MKRTAMLATLSVTSVVAATPSIPEKDVRFPVDPYSFNPRGLQRHSRGDGKNGLILQWMSGKTVIFEWDEDLKYGPHYHCLMPEDHNKHQGDHWVVGSKVPEPWASLYF